MKPSAVFRTLDVAKRARTIGEIFNPMFVSAPGIGKSSIVQAWARNNGLPLIDLRIAYMESPDLIGFPSIGTVNGKQVTIHNLPEFLPTGGEGVLLLEEPNRGQTSVMNCLMQLLTDRKIHNYTLPEGWLVVACVNPEGTEYDVNSMDSALKDRFEMINIDYDKNDFIAYMKNSEWHKDVVQFVEAGLFEYRAPEGIGNVPGAKYVSPRTFGKVNALLKAGCNADDELDFTSAILGNNIAQSFYKFRHDDSPVMMADLVKSLPKALKKLERFADVKNYKNSMISFTVRDIIAVDTIDDKMLISVCKVLPVEQSTALLRGLEFKRNDHKILDRVVAADKVLQENLKSVMNYGK